MALEQLPRLFSPRSRSSKSQRVGSSQDERCHVRARRNWIPSCGLSGKPPFGYRSGQAFSKSVRSGAPPVISCQCSKTTRVILSTLQWPTRRTFKAQMYLMWSPNISNSIPVPIGSTTWNFSGTATNSGTPTNPKWGATGSGSAGTFVASSKYAAWTTHTTNGTCGATN